MNKEIIKNLIYITKHNGICYTKNCEYCPLDVESSCLYRDALAKATEYLKNYKNKEELLELLIEEL